MIPCPKNSDLSHKVDIILDHLNQLTHLQRSPSPSPSPTRHHVKVEIPRYDGHNPMGWILKASQFFDYQETPDKEHITHASFYMDNSTLSWFQWMFRNRFITSWNGLLQALESRFVPSFYDDSKGALFKLSQCGSVNEYLTEFERLTNCVVGLLPSFLLSCFISGLSPDIRCKVQALQPISLPQATTLVKLQEDKLLDRCHSYRPQPLTTPPIPNNTSSFAPPASKPSFVHYTSDEMVFRRKKGMCYNCDEKWNSNHKWKIPILLFIVDTPNSPPSPDLPSPETLDPDFDPLPTPIPHISLNALSGLTAPETFHIYGSIHQARLTVLIDSGSTHHFVKPRVVRFLHLLRYGW